ncbi:glycosyl hydrolase [Cohnella silvisoli]|uniref:Glycosyl hydrolase n=1 Tax=Cohnella silvisoli TaxID=2873699 RepID=A0ABV1KPE0_9BACL|nr:glycosyl hydrolase [Cohnella silvisoli]MCD9025554.1 hypothetical protein [Cohnella silvisoli]
MSSLNGMRDRFANPPAEHRSAPFWSWNDKLSEDELVRQIKDMKANGIGGFFMHSREGLETEYMGAEWMAAVQTAVRTAGEEGMAAWIYDEDRWPSGAAGGLVPAQGGDAYRSKGLTIEVSTGKFEPDDSVLALFKGKIDGDALRECVRLEPYASEEPASGESLLVFRREISLPSEWFNGDAPSDNLNPDSVNAFIGTTYEAYKQEVGGAFGHAIPGIFTDEPNVAHRYCSFTGSRGWVSWTDGFAEYFLERRGYDLLSLVPYLFLDGEEAPKVRHDYWRTVTERFCEAYSRQLGEWCENNGLAFTGHYLFENDMGASIRVGGAVMPHYRYQHVPGIDMLTEQTKENLTVKQCTSVANQFGRQRVLSEMYGCTGWDFDFEGQKWIGDWQYVMGVNLRCQHLALYSLKGCRKRDYPPAFSYNTSWWKYNGLMENYFARLSTVLSEGTPIRDVLVLHPISTAWSMLGTEPTFPGAWIPDKYTRSVNDYGEGFNEFLRYMLGIHYDFDLGDEIIMEQEGTVKESKLYINKAGYSAVLIPPAQTLFGTTIALLLKLLDAGGRVIALEPVPTRIEGVIDDRMAELFAHPQMTIASSRAEAVAALEAAIPRKMSIRNEAETEEQALLYMLREHPDHYSLFLVNNDREQAHSVTVSIPFTGLLEEWDLLTGEIKEKQMCEIDSGFSFGASFGPADSKLYILDKNRRNTEAPAIDVPVFYPADAPGELLASLGPSCRFTRTADNALVLDRCSYRIEKDGWSEETEVWQAQRAVRERLGMRQVYYNGLPQRYKWAGKPHAKDGTPVQFKFSFDVRKVPKEAVYLVLEEARHFTVTLNGQPVENAPEGWFMDRAFDKIKLPHLLEGQNEILLSCEYTNRMELEDGFIVGDFGVDTNRSITEEPAVLHFGDWGLQGYFHYSGSLVYHLDYDYKREAGERLALKLGTYGAVTVEVRVNGQTAGHIPWKAANLKELTGFVRPGRNEIDIEVMGSPRNLFGPLHEANDRNAWTDWRSFRREGDAWTPDYVVKPYGLFGQVQLYRL